MCIDVVNDRETVAEARCTVVNVRLESTMTLKNTLLRHFVLARTGNNVSERLCPAQKLRIAVKLISAVHQKSPSPSLGYHEGLRGRLVFIFAVCSNVPGVVCAGSDVARVRFWKKQQKREHAVPLALLACTQSRSTCLEC